MEEETGHLGEKKKKNMQLYPGDLGIPCSYMVFDWEAV